MSIRAAHRLIPTVRIPLTHLRRTSDFHSDVPTPRGHASPTRTMNPDDAPGPLRNPLIFHAPRVTRTPALLIRSHPSRRVDTFLRGVTRADALADGQTRGLATPHSGHGSGQGVS